MHSPKTIESPESGQQTEDEMRDYRHSITIDLTSAGFSPQTVTISKDTRINWINKDKLAHKLAITPGTATPPQFDNNHQIELNGGYPYVIHVATTFHYYVVDKPTENGTIIVH